MSIQIRSYQLQDCQAIADIYNEAIAKGGITMDCEPYAAVKIAYLADKLGDRETILVAEIEGDVVGWGIIKKYSDRPGYNLCCETSIYLKSSATKKGYGRISMPQIYRVGQLSIALSPIVTVVNWSTTAAILKLWSCLGYQET